MRGVLQDLDRILKAVPEEDTRRFVHAIRDARRVFMSGLGRSGLVARMFGMRLVHLGREATIVGDTTTPAIREGDLLIHCSPTGRSPLDSGQIDISPFELDYLGGRSPLAVNFNDGSDSIFFGYSSRLELLAIVPSAVHNMSITSCSVPDTVPGGQPLTISVTVENLGNYTETTTLALEGNGSTLASSAIEASNPRVTNSFICNWTPARYSSSYTTPVSVKVAAVADEVGIYDNEITRTVTVLPDVVTITSAYWVQSRSSLRGGMTTRIRLPSLAGLSPILAMRMALSMSRNVVRSHG